MAGPRDEIETLRDQLDAGERGGTDAQRQLLLDMSDEMFLLDSEYSDYRHRTLLRKCTIMAEGAGNLDRALKDRAAAEETVRWINSEYSNEETNRDYRSALRVFGKRTVGDGEVPDSLAWVPTTTSRSYDPSPDPGKMYRWEDHVVPMIDAVAQPRDKAVLALQFDAGLRSGEFHDPRGGEWLRVGDITDSRYGLQVSVDGKQGQRSPTLIPSTPYVQDWLNEHPGGDDAPFVSQLSTPEPLSYKYYTDIFKTAARNADIEVPADPTPTRFRKSSASYMASRGVSQAHLEERYGWKHGSDKAARYVTVFGEESEREAAKAYGVELEDEAEPEPTGPITCPRCQQETPRRRDFCIHCNQALDMEMQELVEDVVSKIDSTIVTEDDPEKRAELLRGRRTLEEKPSLMDAEELHDLTSEFSSED